MSAARTQKFYTARKFSRRVTTLWQSSLVSQPLKTCRDPLPRGPGAAPRGRAVIYLRFQTSRARDHGKIVYDFYGSEESGAERRIKNDKNIITLKKNPNVKRLSELGKVESTFSKFHLGEIKVCEFHLGGIKVCEIPPR